MEMTDFEIHKNWKEAKNPDKQVKILADINCCKPSDITAIIRKVEAAQKLSEPVPAEPVPAESAESASAPNDEELVELGKRMAELYNSGATYKEIAAELSLSVSAVGSRISRLARAGRVTIRQPQKSHPQKSPAPAEPKRKSHSTYFDIVGEMDYMLTMLEQSFRQRYGSEWRFTSVKAAGDTAVITYNTDCDGDMTITIKRGGEHVE